MTDEKRPQTDPDLAVIPPELRAFASKAMPDRGVRPGDNPVLDQALADLRAMNDGGDPLFYDVHEPGEAEKAAAKARSVGNASAYVPPTEVPATKLPEPAPLPPVDARRMPTEKVLRIPHAALPKSPEELAVAAGRRRMGGGTLELAIPIPPSPPDDADSVDARAAAPKRALWPLLLLALVPVVAVVLLMARGKADPAIEPLATSAPAASVAPTAKLTPEPLASVPAKAAPPDVSAATTASAPASAEPTRRRAPKTATQAPPPPPASVAPPPAPPTALAPAPPPPPPVDPFLKPPY